jgi:hypothetical protein
MGAILRHWAHFGIQETVTCPDHAPLIEAFVEADRVWLACPANLEGDPLNQSALQARASRIAAANRLYEHRLSCSLCKTSYIKNKRDVDPA